MNDGFHERLILKCLLSKQCVDFGFDFGCILYQKGSTGCSSLLSAVAKHSHVSFEQCELKPSQTQSKDYLFTIQTLFYYIFQALAIGLKYTTNDLRLMDSSCCYLNVLVPSLLKFKSISF